jgi:hypothetical protein
VEGNKLRFDRRLIIVFIVALILTSGAYATTTSISGGTSTSASSGSVQGYTTVNDNGVDSLLDVKGIIDFKENDMVDFSRVHVESKSVLTPDGFDPSYSTSDTQGNAAKVFWDFKAKPGTTTSTTAISHVGKPYSSTAGYGVSEDLQISISNAYWISAGTSASNKEGDYAAVNAWAGSTYTIIPSASINNYYTKAYAYSNVADAIETATSVSDSSNEGSSIMYEQRPFGQVYFNGQAHNLEGDSDSAGESAADDDTQFSHSVILTNPTIHSYASKTKTYVRPTGSISTTGSGTLDSMASNKEGDWAHFRLDLNTKDPDNSGTGTLTGADFYAVSLTNEARTSATIAKVYSDNTKITSEVFDRAKGFEYDQSVAGRPLVGITGGGGTFSALRPLNYPFTNVVVDSIAYTNDVSITATGFGTKTALLLDPRRWEFVTSYGTSGIDFQGPVTNALLSKGYAVTYYNDAAVTKDKVFTMDDYYVSVLDSHGGPYGMDLTKTTDGKTFDTIDFTTLQGKYTKKNGMALLIGCETFNPDKNGVQEGAQAVQLANVRGGIQGVWYIGQPNLFLNQFFGAMANGYTAYQANNYARYKDPVDGKYKSLTLYPDKSSFVL